MSRAIALEWLKAAADDLRLISNIIDDSGLTHLVAFHCQQAVEKSLKAALEYDGRDVPRKHDLLMLKDSLSDFILLDNEEILEALNSLYTESRYPGMLGLLPNGKPTVSEAKEFYAFARMVYDDIKKQIQAV